MYNDDELIELLDQIDYEEEHKYIQSIEEKDINYCETCNSSENIVEDFAQGIMVCIKCGTVISEIMDDNPEWKTYEDNDRNENARCSHATNTFLPQSSLGTMIGGPGRSRIKIMQSWNAMPYKERSLHGVLKEIQFRCRKAGIMKCIEDDAKILYKKISECKNPKTKGAKHRNVIIRGTNRQSLIAACVFYACLRKNDTRSPKEIANIFDLKYTDITNGRKTFLNLLEISKMEYSINTSAPDHFIKRFCLNLHIKGNYVDKCLQIAKNIQRLNLASVHIPVSVATASILLMIEVYNLPISKKSIASKVGVSEVTMLKAYKKLEPYKYALIDDNLTDKLLVLIDEERKKLFVPSVLVKPTELEYRDIDIENNDFEQYQEYVDNYLSEKLNDTEQKYKKQVDRYQSLKSRLYPFH